MEFLYSACCLHGPSLHLVLMRCKGFSVPIYEHSRDGYVVRRLVAALWEVSYVGSPSVRSWTGVCTGLAFFNGLVVDVSVNSGHVGQKRLPRSNPRLLRLARGLAALPADALGVEDHG